MTQQSYRAALDLFPHLIVGEVVMYLQAGFAGARPGIIVGLGTDGAAISWWTPVGDVRIALHVKHGNSAGNWLFRDEYLEQYVKAATHVAASTHEAHDASTQQQP